MKSIDLSYLKKLVAELENEIKAGEAEVDPSLTDEDRELAEQDRRLSLSRAAGISMSVAQEGTMLMYDIQKVIAGTFMAPKASKEDVLESTLSNFLKSHKVGGNQN